VNAVIVAAMNAEALAQVVNAVVATEMIVVVRLMIPKVITKTVKKMESKFAANSVVVIATTMTAVVLALCTLNSADEDLEAGDLAVKVLMAHVSVAEVSVVQAHVQWVSALRKIVMMMVHAANGSSKVAQIENIATSNQIAAQAVDSKKMAMRTILKMSLIAIDY
jgi:hypothetical protein